MKYAVLIDELVLQDDFKGIELHHQRRIIKTIRERLSTEPDRYGEPLRGELKGYWKLRVGEFRVICEIREESAPGFLI